MDKRKIGWLPCFALLGAAWLTGLAGCNRSQNTLTEPLDLSSIERVPVVVTYSILADWVERVGGDRVDVTTLVGPDGDTHSYEPVPRDAVAISKAAILFENGLGFEDWLGGLYDSSQTRAVRVAVASNIAPRKHRCACCANSDTDPHVWHSVKNAILMVGVIADQLAALDSTHADGYRQRAQEYIGQLQRLDAEIREQVESIPEERRRLVTSHDSFGYFAAEYGFHVVSLLDSFTSEASDPSAVKLVSVVRKVREHQVPAIFSENMLTSKLTETVAREAGVETIARLYTDALGPADSEAADYCGMMRANTQTIVQSLK